MTDSSKERRSENSEFPLREVKERGQRSINQSMSQARTRHNLSSTHDRIQYLFQIILFIISIERCDFVLFEGFCNCIPFGWFIGSDWVELFDSSAEAKKSKSWIYASIFFPNLPNSFWFESCLHIRLFSELRKIWSQGWRIEIDQWPRCPFWRVESFCLTVQRESSLFLNPSENRSFQDWK